MYLVSTSKQQHYCAARVSECEAGALFATNHFSLLSLALARCAAQPAARASLSTSNK